METFNWEKSRSLFEESSRLENPAGTYYLAKWYGTGCGTEADPDEYRRKLEEAARNGSRLARYEWANGVLAYGSASPVEKAKAVDFLKSAYSLKTVATLTTVLTSQRSVQLLSRYYQKTGQGIRAFLATRSYLKAFDNPHIRYHDHLVNTLTLGLSRRALKAVREGETLGIPNCYYIHGMMYAQGIGEKENRREAEKYLRYAGDELHYREAYLGLAMLSDKRKAKRASDFWRMMYDVNFSDTIAE